VGSARDSSHDVLFDGSLMGRALPIVVVEARFEEELALSLVVELTIFLLLFVHLTFEASSFLFELEYGLVLVLYQSRHVGDTLLKLTGLALESVFLEAIILEF
jgi:hypothetical protein